MGRIPKRDSWAEINIEWEEDSNSRVGLAQDRERGYSNTAGKAEVMALFLRQGRSLRKELYVESAHCDKQCVYLWGVAGMG